MDSALQSPAVVQGLWIGEALSTMERLSVQSFLMNGHPYHLYVYDDVKNVPDAVVIKDASEIFPRERIFRYRSNESVAGFANLFRYKLVYERGGIWADTDVVALKPFASSRDHLVALEFARPGWRLPPYRSQAANWFIQAPAGSRLMKYCLDEADRRDPATLTWGQTGPQLLTQAVKKLGYDQAIAPFGTFYPLWYRRWYSLIEPTPLRQLQWKLLGPVCSAIHLYNEMWRRKAVDKDGHFPSTSIYEDLKRRYLS